MAKQTVEVKIEYQVRIAGYEGQASKTFEYSTDGYMKADKAFEPDQIERELYVLTYLVKEFKELAKKRAKELAKKKKAAKKAA